MCGEGRLGPVRGRVGEVAWMVVGERISTRPLQCIVVVGAVVSQASQGSVVSMLYGMK